MKLTEIVIDGTIKSDGTLELDQKPNLSPGRVQVIVKPLPTDFTPRPGLAEVIQQIRQAQQARGFVGRSAAELEAEQKTRGEEEDEYELRCQSLWSQTQSGPPK